MGPEAAPAPDAAANQEQGAPQAQGGAMNQDQAKQVTDAVVGRASEVIQRMQELAFVLSKLGVDPESLKQLSGEFKGFMATLEGILGGKAPSPDQVDQAEGEPQENGSAPQQKGNQPVDEQSAGRGVPMV